jgi:hypothetical protein
MLHSARAFAIGDWVLVKPQESYPLHKLGPRSFGPFLIQHCDADSEIVVVIDHVKNKLRKFLKRSLEAFDVSLLFSVEGLKRVAERDNFEFPVEAIVGHALIGDGGVGADAVQLPNSYRRGNVPKSRFQFLIKWSGYDEATFIAYKDAAKLPQFPGYAVMFPGLAMC